MEVQTLAATTKRGVCERAANLEVRIRRARANLYTLHELCSDPYTCLSERLGTPSIVEVHMN